MCSQPDITPKISIITVVYNAREDLLKTLTNILEQDWPAIETIIVDGGSTDGTREVILQHQSSITRWISEPDEGLYDAMNKGLQLATGDYVWFINAGDRIYSPTTIRQIFSNETRADIYYGDTLVVDSAGREIGLRRLRPPDQLTWKSFRHGMLVCHQSILVGRQLAGPYDLRYPHSADFDWVIRALKNAEHIIHTRLILSAFQDGGQSKQTIRPSLIERLQIMARYYGLLPSLIRHLPIAFRFIAYYLKNQRF